MRAKTTCAPFSSPPRRLASPLLELDSTLKVCVVCAFTGENSGGLLVFYAGFHFTGFYRCLFFSFAHRALADLLRAPRKSSIYEIIFILVRRGGVLWGFGPGFEEPSFFSPPLSQFFAPNSATMPLFSLSSKVLGYF